MSFAGFSQLDHEYHVLPIDDLLPHRHVGRGCRCGPKVKEFGNDARVVVHNSFDGRELAEVHEARYG